MGPNLETKHPILRPSQPIIETSAIMASIPEEGSLERRVYPATYPAVGLSQPRWCHCRTFVRYHIIDHLFLLFLSLVQVLLLPEIYKAIVQHVVRRLHDQGSECRQDPKEFVPHFLPISNSQVLVPLFIDTNTPQQSTKQHPQKTKSPVLSS